MYYYELLNEKFSNKSLQDLLILNHPTYDNSKQYNYILIINYWKDIDKCVSWLFLNNDGNINSNLDAKVGFNYDSGWYYFETITTALSFNAIFKINFNIKLNNYANMTIPQFQEIHGSFMDKDRLS